MTLTIWAMMIESGASRPTTLVCAISIPHLLSFVIWLFLDMEKGKAAVADSLACRRTTDDVERFETPMQTNRRKSTMERRSSKAMGALGSGASASPAVHPSPSATSDVS